MSIEGETTNTSVLYAPGIFSIQITHEQAIACL